MRYLVGFFVAAVIAAATLRHVLHVHAGFEREEIRTGVLITAGIGIFLIIVLFRLSRRS